MSADYICQILWSLVRVLKNGTLSKMARLLDTASKYALISVSGLKDEKLIRKQTYAKTETCELYSRAFWIFLRNVIKIDPNDFELYGFKVGAFLRHSVFPPVISHQGSWVSTLSGYSTCSNFLSPSSLEIQRECGKFHLRCNNGSSMSTLSRNHAPPGPPESSCPTLQHVINLIILLARYNLVYSFDQRS